MLSCRTYDARMCRDFMDNGGCALHAALLDKKDIDANQRRMMQSHLAHKYRKRQEGGSEKASSTADGSSSANINETRRMLKHGATVHQLRSMQVTATGMMKNPKVQCEKDGLGVAGASCSSGGASSVHSTKSTALVRAASSNNNKHH